MHFTSAILVGWTLFYATCMPVLAVPFSRRDGHFYVYSAAVRRPRASAEARAELSGVPTQTHPITTPETSKSSQTLLLSSIIASSKTPTSTPTLIQSGVNEGPENAELISSENHPGHSESLGKQSEELNVISTNALHPIRSRRSLNNHGRSRLQSYPILVSGSGLFSNVSQVGENGSLGMEKQETKNMDTRSEGYQGETCECLEECPEGGECVEEKVVEVYEEICEWKDDSEGEFTRVPVE